MSEQTSGMVGAAMNAVQADLAKHGIAKGQTNTFDRYKFRGIDDVYNTLGPLLAKHKLIITTSVLARESTMIPTQKGGQQFHVVLTVELAFRSAVDDSVVRVVHYGEAMDRGDKATPKALSAAYKYGVFSVFCIPTEASPDADAEAHELDAPVGPPKLTEQQAASLKGLLGQLPVETTVAFLKAYKAPTIEELDSRRYDAAMKALREKVAEAA